MTRASTAACAAAAGHETPARAGLGRGVQLDPEDLAGILNDLQAQGLVVRAPDDVLLAPLSAAERDRFTDLLIRIPGTQS